MCSWCWGFTPVITAIREQYRDRLKVALMLGGLRPGTTEPVSASFREELLGHWHEVQERSAQSFLFEGALPEGFVYDTEPPSRAVVTVGELRPEATFAYFKSVQAAFYGEGRDVTHPQVLADLAEGQEIEAAAFLARFASNALREKTQKHFHMSRQVGVRGFPTLVAQDGEGMSLLTDGYRSFAELQPLIDAWLAGEVRKA